MFIYESQNFKNLRNHPFLNDSISFSSTNNSKKSLLFPIDEDKIVKNIGLIGIYKSASITFYSKKYGYLLCQEFRDNKLVYHPIGGKYEDRDKSIEYTACREFIEESGILKNNEFMNLLSNYISLDNNILCYNKSLFNEIEQKAIDFIYNILTNDKITNYYDFYVNVNKEYIHKYYLINIDYCDNQFKKIIENINTFYEDTFKENGNNNEYIIGLYWDKEIMKAHFNKKNYSMLTIYLSNLIKSYKNNKS